MHHSQRATPTVAPSTAVRRGRDRRRRVWWSILYGNFNPRRRHPPRRVGDFRHHSLDWHASHLLALSIGILLLSAADAFMTVTLMSGGADEVNPVMALLIYRSAALFVARYRFLQVVRVEVVMYGLFFGYIGLLGYEFWMLRALHDILEL
jgi:hypothetical protein